MKSLPALIIAAAFLTHWVSHAVAVTAVSNLSNADIGVSPLTLGTRYSYGTAATSFTTGDAPAILNSATFIFLPSVGTPSNTYFGAIAADASGHPDAILEDFPPTSVGPLTGIKPLTFTSAGLPLQPHTTYWLLAGGDSPISYWLDTQLSNETSAYGWTIGDASLGYTFPDGIWQPGMTFDPAPIGRMSVDATFVPEPTSAILLISAATLSLSRRRRKQPCRKTVVPIVSL